MTNWNSFFEGILDERLIKVNEPMANHNTYGIGGNADVFVSPADKESLIAVLRKAAAEGLPVTLIGGGSNCLISDKGIRGVTICTSRIKPEMTCFETWITAYGGVGTGTVARFAQKNSLTGFEWAVGIPGTLCGAAFMNANGYGSKMRNVVEEVYAVSIDGEIDKVYGWDDLHYGESDSVFMHNGDVIYGVKLHLAMGDSEKIKAEMDDHLGYEKSERSDNDDYRNGYKRKQVNSRYGSMEIEVPQDRKSTFEPQVVKKRQKDISDIDQKIISMYAKGMTTRQISETIEDIYGFETSESFISDVTDKILPQIEDWQNRPLDDVYPILYIDAIHYSVRDNGVIRKLAAYVILGIKKESKKEVLTITIGDNESAKYWLSALNELKNRGVKDILIICADGLTGIKEAISAAFPKTEYQRCIVHQVRNTLKYVPDKDRKAFATDLKTIYQAADE